MSLVVDTSALAAVILGEPDAESYLGVMTGHAGEVFLSAASAVELGIVVDAKQGPEATADLRRLTELLGITTVAFDAAQASVAVSAWRRFGKGRHPAGLNLGDCFSYALAKTSGSALLYKGQDFGQTDITSAL
jgi:ribonuclease VapC